MSGLDESSLGGIQCTETFRFHEVVRSLGT